MTAPPQASVPTASASSVDSEILRGTRWLTVATFLVGLVNYAYGLSLTHVLDVSSYSVFAAAQSLLLVVGTIASASIPRVLARDLARAGSDLAQRREVVWFASVVNLLQGVIGAALVAVLASQFAGAPVVLVAAVGGALVFAGSTPLGWAQGERRFRLLATMRVVEVVAKAGLGFALAMAGAGAAGALAGIALGGLLLAGWGVVLMRHDLRVVPGVLRRMNLWRAAFGIAAVQGLVSLLASADIVLVTVLASEAADAANYQVSMIIARAPLFLAGAVATVVFPMFEPQAVDAGRLFRAALRRYALLVVPFTITLATVPPSLLGFVFPEDYDRLSTLLVATSVAGSLIGLLSLLTIFYQSSGWFGHSLRRQVIGLGLHGAALLVGWALGGVLGLAIGAATGAGASALLLYVDAKRRWGGQRSSRPRLPLVTWLLLAIVLLVAPPVVWFVTAAAAGAWAAYTGLVRKDLPEAWNYVEASGSELPPRVLHLGFEDFRRPGSGGGSVRTHQINRRLSTRFDVTVLTSSWPGCQDRVEDGVRYVHIGYPGGYWVSLVTYFLALPFQARRRPADLVVEDFAAPISSALSPLWDRRPRLAMVQWLNAREKSHQYKLPFFLMESLGVYLHRRYITVSEDLAATIRDRNPRAEVTVVPNGVEREAFDIEASDSGDVVYLGRLEIAQKGCDLLLEAFARIAPHTSARLVLVGDGPDRERLLRLAASLGIAERVDLPGRLEGRAKYELLASARLVAMPSRFETFGMVAVEALACGTPVLAFEIECLRAVVPEGGGELVPPFSVEAYAEGLAALLADPDRAKRMGIRGRAFARAFDWDIIAEEQAEIYDSVMGGTSRT